MGSTITVPVTQIFKNYSQEIVENNTIFEHSVSQTSKSISTSVSQNLYQTNVDIVENVSITNSDIQEISKTINIEISETQEPKVYTVLVESGRGPKGDTGETGPEGPKGDKGDPGDSGEATADIYRMTNPDYPNTNKIFGYSISGDIDSISVYSEDGNTLLFTKESEFDIDGNTSETVTTDLINIKTLTKTFTYTDGEISSINITEE